MLRCAKDAKAASVRRAEAMRHARMSARAYAECASRRYFLRRAAPPRLSAATARKRQMRDDVICAARAATRPCRDTCHAVRADERLCACAAMSRDARLSVYARCGFFALFSRRHAMRRMRDVRATSLGRRRAARC